MNQDGNEQKIKQLFFELKREDERRAPSFNRDWQLAVSRTGKTRPPRPAMRLAVAAALLIVLGSLAVIFFTHLEGPYQAPEAAASFSQWQSPTITLLNPPVDAPPSTVLQQQPGQPWQPIVSTPQWQSPTDFLLAFPGEQVLKTVPKLGESLMETKALMPDERD